MPLDELRAEQDHVSTQSKSKHSMEVQLSELEARFAEATDAANRGGRTAMAKLESRIRELEIEVSRQLKCFHSKLIQFFAAWQCAGKNWRKPEGPSEG